MTAVDDLYRRVVLDHGKRPRHRGPVAGATHAAEGDNPLCGDALRVELVIDGDRVRAVGFTGESCAIATASASLMSERVRDCGQAEARRVAAAMEALCTAGAPDGAAAARALGDLMAFAACTATRCESRVRCSPGASCAGRFRRLRAGIERARVRRCDARPSS